MIVTREFLKKYATNGVGFTRKQLDILGVDGKKGWVNKIVGKDYCRDTLKEYARLGIEQQKKNAKTKERERLSRWNSIFDKVKKLDDHKFEIIMKKLNEINS